MYRQFLEVIIISSEKQKGSTKTFTYHADIDEPIEPGAIIYVPLVKQTVIGVVTQVGTNAPQYPTKSITCTTQFRLTETQISLVEWLSRHYATPIATIYGLFITAAVVSPPIRRWQITDAGMSVDFATLPEDERTLLYLLKKHHVMSERDIQAQTITGATSFAQLCKWLSARGYITLSYAIDNHVVTLPHIKMIRYVDSIDYIPTKHQKAIIDRLRAAPLQQLPLRDIGSSVSLNRLIDARVCEHIEVLPTQAPITASVELSAAQQHVSEKIISTLSHHHTFLLDGVTGSGKTEVYFAIIDACLSRGLQVLVLVPEIALTTQLAERFSRRFPGRVGVIHGQISASQRRTLWLQSLANTIPIIIGPRSALSVPQPRLGAIIIDEEHDASFKSEFSPFINARDAAIMYARLAKIPIVLGSATPSVELMYAASQHRISHLTLPERIDTTGTRLERPSVRVVDMRTESCVDQHGVIGNTLADAITTTLSQDHHVLLLLNRRGNSGVRMCRQCGAVSRCEQCSTPMSIHLIGSTPVSMCHTCGRQRIPDPHCRECYHVEFVEYGSGTQRVCEIIQALHPDVTVIQWDRDTAETAQDHRTLLNAVTSSERAVIVGTQMIAKGLDLPKIRLVGVINTDIALHLPDFRAAERTYQLLTQVAGRAGRRQGSAHVIFQSYQPDNYAIQAAARYQSSAFYDQELAFRKHLGYPPFQRMIKLMWTHRNARTCEENARSESAQIHRILTHEFPHARLIGPTPAFFTRIRGLFRWQLLIVASQPRQIMTRIEGMHRAIVDVDPNSML